MFFKFKLRINVVDSFVNFSTHTVLLTFIVTFRAFKSTISHEDVHNRHIENEVRFYENLQLCLKI